MWIWIANKFAKFHAKRLNRSKIFQQILGRLLFETPCTHTWWTKSDTTLFSSSHHKKPRLVWLFRATVYTFFIFTTGQTAVKLSGAEDADRAQCAAPDKPIGCWNLLVVFANLKRVIQCACFKSPGSRKGALKCSLCILAVAQHLPRKWRLVSSSSLQTGHNGSLTLRIIVRCRLRVLCLVRRYTRMLRSRRHYRKANCKSWCDLSYQFFSLSTTFSIKPIMVNDMHTRRRSIKPVRVYTNYKLQAKLTYIVFGNKLQCFFASAVSMWITLAASSTKNQV